MLIAKLTGGRKAKSSTEEDFANANPKSLFIALEG
jgi:hypothetical protein